MTRRTTTGLVGIEAGLGLVIDPENYNPANVFLGDCGSLFIGYMMAALTLLVLGIESLTRGRARYHTTGQARPARQLRLGAWRWPAAFFCFVVS